MDFRGSGVERCGLKVCVPAKFIFENLIPSVMMFGGEAFGRLLCHEGGVFKDGINALRKETPKLSCPFLYMRTWG